MTLDDPFAARCRELATVPYYAPFADVFLDAALSIEGGGISGPIGLQSALGEAGVDPEDAAGEIMAVTHWLVSADPGGIHPDYQRPAGEAS